MHFRSRRNTRRLTRAEVLEVKAVTGSRPVWFRRLMVALALAGVVLLALHTGLRAWTALRDRVLSGRFFALQAIEVNTNLVWLTPQEVVKWSGIRPGENLLAIDLNRVKRDLELVPQVEEAIVERVLPRLLRISIRERRPVAQVRTLTADEGRLVPAVFFLDAYAQVMPPLAAGRGGDLEGLAQLPVITGLNDLDLRVGHAVRSPAVRAALELAAAFPRSPMAERTTLASIDITEPDVLQAVTAQGSAVLLSFRQLDLQLRRWRLVHDAGLRDGRWIQWLDLSVTNNCPVLWQSQAAQPPPALRPVESAWPGGHHV